MGFAKRWAERVGQEETNCGAIFDFIKAKPSVKVRCGDVGGA
jgi:hypothetical protein